MENTKNHHETKVLKGSNVLEKLCDECLSLGDKVLIVFSENSIKQSGLYARVISLLNICGIEHITFECAGSTYSEQERRDAIELGKKKNVNLVLAIGDEELMCFTKIVAHDFHADEFVNKPVKHLPIINIASIIKGSKSVDFVPANNYYTHIKPVALFLDYEF